MFETYIYIDWRLNKLEPIYVGKGRKGRAVQHLDKTHNRFFKNKMNQMRRAGIEPAPYIIDAPSNEAACAYERFFIGCFGREDLGTGALTNRTDGGEGLDNVVFTDAHRQGIAAYQRGRTRSSETRKRMSAAQRGRKVEKETGQKIAQALRGKTLPEEHKQKIAMASKNRSPEYKERMSAAIKAAHARRKAALTEEEIPVENI